MNMSKREQEKAIDATKQVAEYMRNATAKRFQESINTSLDETRSQIPRYTNVVKNYQDQALESTGKTVENYLEAQKSIINSVFDSVVPYYENVNRMYSYWLSPRVPAEIWARSVSNIAENISAARTYNDILFGNIDAFGNAFERAQRQTEELSRINVNNVKTIANTAKEAAAEFSNNPKLH